MTEFAILEDLGVILGAALVLALIARAIRVPAIVAYIVAGLLLGPTTGLVTTSEGVELISEVGIALLLFLVGLELSFATVKDVGVVALVGGVAQVVISAVAGTGVALAFGLPAGQALFLGVALSFSSTVVVVKLLEQRGDLTSTYGRIALGILLVQDLLVVLVLTFVSGLGREAGGSLGRMLVDLVISFGGMGVLVAVSIGASRHLLPRLFGWIAPSGEALLVWSLCWCFLMILGAEAMALSVELGAFLAGVSLAQLPINHELRRRVAPLVNFFIAVFFVTLGVHMDPRAAAGSWPLALALTVFVLLGKPSVLLAVIPRLGFGERTAAMAGITLGQTSEFSFILGGLGLSAGLIDAETLAVVGVVGLATMAVSSGSIQSSRRLYAWLRLSGVLRVFRAPHEGPRDRAEAGGAEHSPGPFLRDHVIVVGMNSLGERVVSGLRERGETTLAVDTDPRKLDRVGGLTLHGNTDDLAVLKTAGIRRARLLVSALQIEDSNNLLAYRSRAFGVPCSIHAFDQSVVRDLEEIGVTHLINSKAAGTRRIAEALHDEGIYG